ncbi:condensin complex subunit 3 isoform X2 [Hyposmocoma kahamanoa]|uniref:condensin complex subunit 3 isoform X2 n=1 Tax=Hyposmocoma kahamanoa TaxID=1477025 RepID=UPI000E6D9406|nr:condensin complex subunit 3 isoform X2 [Hyposmocoma kahamanoa]
MPPTDAKAPPPVTATKPNPHNNPAMFKIFQNVQYNIVQHKKYVKEMKKLYKNLDEDSFRKSFKNALLYLFTFGDTSANVDRVVQFVATFCTALDDEEEFLLFIFDIIFDCQCVSGQSVRYRASQLLAAVLSALGEDASLDDDLCDKLLSSQMQRLQDTRGAVRCRAALALQRLQNPPDDDVTRAYRFHMSCDPSSSVRRAVLMSIAKCKNNVPFVLERLCDVDEAVRRAAFLYMAAMPVTQLKVTQRMLTLKVGLTERSPRVRRVVEEILIPGWLSTFHGNIIDLLKAIRLDNSHDAKDSQYVAGKLLESLFKRLPISELLEWLPTDKNLRLIPAEKLNKETAWYWRHLAEHLQKIEDDETLETVLPDLVVLTGYIRAIVESPCPIQTEDPVGFSTRQYVLHELGYMLRVYDASDPTGRDALKALLTDILTGEYGPLNSEVIRAFVSALEMVVPDVTQRIELVYGVISSLRDPPEPETSPPPPPPAVDDTKVKLERARLRVSLNVAIEAQEEAVREQNYALAAECKAKVEDIQKKLEELTIQPAPPPPPPAPVPTIKEKISDADTLNKCLTILNCVLDTPQLKNVTPMLKMIFEELEVEIFQNPDILETALETVALFGMLDKDMAKENKAFFFANLIDTSNEPIVSTVLKCLVDLLCVHGARVFEDDSNNDTNKSKNTTRRSMDINHDGTVSESVISMSPDHSTVIEILLKIMDVSCAAYRLIIVEGLCRLLYLGHLESPTILCRLLLLWFNPATVEEDNLRQTIGVFFQTFPASVDGAQDQIQKATLPILRALANAPSSSPLAEIDQEAVVRFIVSLTRVNHELTDSQGGMAMLLTNSLARRPTAAEAGLVCRMLALLSPPREARLAAELANTLRDVCLKLPDRQSSRNLTRYLGALEAMERASLNKLSHTGIVDGTMQNEDTMSIGRATTSLPQPIARSTHVVINETVEEEMEIDETSPVERISKINKEIGQTIPEESPKSPLNTSGSDSAAADAADVPTDSSSGISPVKKAKVSKSKKKKLSPTPKSSETDKQNQEKRQENNEGGGIKRSRSQRSVVDVDRARKAKAEATTKKQQSPPKQKKSPLEDLDVSNVTIRRSGRGVPSQSSTDSKAGNKKKGAGKKGKQQEAKSRPATRASVSSRSSAGSVHSMCDNSADETELHTIVYENEFEQEILNDSSELCDSKCNSKTNVTVPETPEDSEESESESAHEPTKTKSKRSGKKK